MKKTNKTEIVFILDRSGSMSGLEGDTIGGYNSFLEKQQKQKSEARITTVLFDDKYELLHDRIDLQGVSKITEQDYFVRGSTALLDAIGKSIQKITNALKNSKPEYRAENVIFVITTDGMENASREYSYDKIKKMVEQKKSEHGWEFIFLGANIDAIETAGRFGIAPGRAQNYHADEEGLDCCYAAVSSAIMSFREESALPADWGAVIEEDYKSRKA